MIEVVIVNINDNIVFSRDDNIVLFYFRLIDYYYIISSDINNNIDRLRNGARFDFWLGAFAWSGIRQFHMNKH